MTSFIGRRQLWLWTLLPNTKCNWVWKPVGIRWSRLTTKSWQLPRNWSTNQQLYWFLLSARTIKMVFLRRYIRKGRVIWSRHLEINRIGVHKTIPLTTISQIYLHSYIKKLINRKMTIPKSFLNIIWIRSKAKAEKRENHGAKTTGKLIHPYKILTTRRRVSLIYKRTSLNIVLKRATLTILKHCKLRS